MSVKKLNIVVAGATGFVGLDLIKFLSNHPKVKIKYLCAQKNIGKKIQYFDKRITKNLPKISKLKTVDWATIDILFTALPNGESQIISKTLVNKKLKIIDLSADFRLSDDSVYKKFYGREHAAKKLINNSVYALSEFTKKKIKKI